jgi:hypothetical protein
LGPIDQNFFEEEEIVISEKSKTYRERFRSQGLEVEYEEEIKEYSKVTRKNKKSFKETKGENK